jgi:hypothetical protein
MQVRRWRPEPHLFFTTGPCPQSKSAFFKGRDGCAQRWRPRPLPLPQGWCWRFLRAPGALPSPKITVKRSKLRRWRRWRLPRRGHPLARVRTISAAPGEGAGAAAAMHKLPQLKNRPSDTPTGAQLIRTHLLLGLLYRNWGAANHQTYIYTPSWSHPS